MLLLLAFALALAIAGKNCPMFDSALRARRWSWSGALTAILLFSVIYAAGRGGGSANIASPPVVTPTGTSTILVTPAAMSSTGQPLQLQPIQLTLTVK